MGQTKEKQASMTALEKYWLNIGGVGGKETKKVVDITKGDNVLREYYKFNKARADRGYPGKFEVYEMTGTDGKMSEDKSFLAIVKNVYLSPRVDGSLMEEPTDAIYESPLYDELKLIDASLKVLWKKRFEWGRKAYKNTTIMKVAKNGNVLVSLPDTSAGAYDRHEWPDVITVYDKTGNDIFRYLFAATTDGPYITDNGRFVYVGESITRTKKERWRVYDLKKGDSVTINRTIGKEGPVHVDDNGRISMSSNEIVSGIKWLMYDSLKLYKKDSNNE
jgi:co-chaperonin GroES (HSP10)